MDKNTVYQKQIEPLLKKITKLCADNGIDMFCAVDMATGDEQHTNIYMSRGKSDGRDCALDPAFAIIDKIASGTIVEYSNDERVCPTCGGDGYVQDELWSEYFESGYPSQTSDEWFGSRIGWYTTPPPEEKLCPTCDGTGLI